MKKILSKIPGALYVLYLAALLVITVLRPWTMSWHLLGGSVNAKLMSEYVPLYRYDLPLFIWLFFGNIVWFMPLGFFQGYFRGRGAGGAVLRGFLLSLFIEVMQFVLGTGVSELDDLILNTLGSLLGWGLAALLTRLRRSGQSSV